LRGHQAEKPKSEKAPFAEARLQIQTRGNDRIKKREGSGEKKKLFVSDKIGTPWREYPL
jgi:hypothetical protein